MLNISVEKTSNSVMTISPMSIKRDWMDNTPQNHAYRCFPVTQSNVVGWSLSSVIDIEFINFSPTSKSGPTIVIKI